TSKPPRSRRRWSIMRSSMSDHTRVDAERQSYEILAVIGKLEPGVRPVPPDQLEGIARSGRDSQPQLLGEIPMRGRQGVRLGPVGGAQADDYAPVGMFEELHPPAQGEAPVGLCKAHAVIEGGIEEFLVAEIGRAHV